MKFRNRKGFTLLELLVVIGIIAILVAIGTVAYSTAQKNTRDSRRKQDLQSVQNALEQYYAQNNYQYPVSPGCTDLVLNGRKDYLASGKMPVDPLDSDDYKYSFECTGTGYVLRACTEGGENPCKMTDSPIEEYSVELVNLQ